ncbi:MAG: hypothetical protein HXS52_05775 [Theionarchaea archaeon]|nr:hypothetical protein [Theionarchaea archaeon]
MIEIDKDSVRIADINKLIQGDPLDEIFVSLNEIWNYALSEEDNYYPLGEKLTSKFEEQVFRIFPEVFDSILQNVGKNNAIPMIALENCFCLIIMDGMSLREAIPLSRDLKRHKEIRYGYTLSAIPSETEFFTSQYFNTSSPSQIRTGDEYYYVHLEREDAIGDIPVDKNKLLIWSTFPDFMFSQFTSAFETQDLKKVLSKTKSILFELLEHLSFYDRIIVTSDHGYFVDTFSWKGLSDFPSNKRYSSSVPESLKRYCRQFDNYWILVGRYNTIKRGKYVHVRHGGLSFLETIIPFIEIKQNRGR